MAESRTEDQAKKGEKPRLVPLYTCRHYRNPGEFNQAATQMTTMGWVLHSMACAGTVIVCVWEKPPNTTVEKMEAAAAHYAQVERIRAEVEQEKKRQEVWAEEKAALERAEGKADAE